MTNIINTVDVLDQRYYEVKDQTDEGCFFYPEAIPGEPVYFPGTCDDSIATVTDLDVARVRIHFNAIMLELCIYHTLYILVLLHICRHGCNPKICN